MKKMLSLLLALMLIVAAPCAMADEATGDSPIEIKALILPKFESGEMTGDFLARRSTITMAIAGTATNMKSSAALKDNKLYVKDGVALYVTGMGKVNLALSLQAILNDDRFDFSNAYIISTGCAGSAIEYGVMGDVFVITATVDFDLGHHADPREMTSETETTWFHDDGYDSSLL